MLLETKLLYMNSRVSDSRSKGRVFKSLPCRFSFDKNFSRLSKRRNVVQSPLYILMDIGPISPEPRRTLKMTEKSIVFQISIEIPKNTQAWKLPHTQSGRVYMWLIQLWRHIFTLEGHLKGKLKSIFMKYALSLSLSKGYLGRLDLIYADTFWKISFIGMLVIEMSKPKIVFVIRLLKLIFN